MKKIKKKTKRRLKKAIKIFKIIFYVLIFPIYIVITLERLKKKIKFIEKKNRASSVQNSQLVLLENEHKLLKEEIEVLKIVDKIKN